MRRIFPVISLIGLCLVIGPAILYLADAIEKDAMQIAMLVGTAVWFASAPFWTRPNSQETPKRK